MPTYENLPDFPDDWEHLTREQKRHFRAAVRKFVADLKTGGNFRASLRVMPMHANSGVWEMTWEGNNGRATFSYGPEIRPGERHVIIMAVPGRGARLYVPQCCRELKMSRPCHLLRLVCAMISDPPG